MDISNTILSLSALTLILSGCMSQQIANTKHMDDAVLKQAASSTQTPQQICETASMAIAEADKESLHFFAPLHLEQASDNLQEGQEKIKVKETQAQGVAQCFKVNKLIENGIAIKQKVKTSLADSLAELDMLKKVDEEKKFTDDIQDHVDDVMGLIKDIEAGRMNEAMQGQAELLKEMLELEIDIVTDRNLTPVEVMLEKAEDADADELAEKTFEKAEMELVSAKKFIEANYRNNEQVKKTSALAMRAAKHAYHVAKEVETLKALKPDAAEEKVLYIETLLERINKKFNKDVVIGNSLYEQSTIIAQRLDSLYEDKAALVREVDQFKREQSNEVVVTQLPAETSVEPVSLNNDIADGEAEQKMDSTISESVSEVTESRTSDKM